MKSILIIDDSNSIRQYLRQILENNQYQVYEAGCGCHAYEIYKQVMPDFVLTDIFMPEMDGFEVIRKLIQEFPGVRIIAMSGGGTVTELPYFKISKRLGVIGCIEKPIQKDILLDMLNKSS